MNRKTVLRLAAAALLAGMPVIAAAQTSSCTTDSGGFTCNMYEGASGAPSNIVTTPVVVNPGYVVFTTGSDNSQTQFWTNILDFESTGSSSTVQLFSDPFGSNGTPAFTYAQITAAPHLFNAYSPDQPIVYAPDEMHVYNVYSNGLNPVTTPEPSSMALLGTGLFGLVPVLRRRRRIS